jgi:hypothetical protein
LEPKYFGRHLQAVQGIILGIGRIAARMQHIAMMRTAVRI